MRGTNFILNEVSVEKWVYGGDGLARVDGRVVLTPYVLPGEKARIEIVEDRRGVTRGAVRETLERAAERIDPACPYFYRCGGCHYQHAAYEFQVAQKAEILREQLRRVGRVAWDGPIATVAGEPFGYRNRSQFHIERGAIGYFGEGSRELVAIGECPISSPRINEALQALLEMVRDRRWPGFLRELELFTNETDVLLNVVESEQPVARSFFDWAAERIPGAQRGWLSYPAVGRSFQVSHNSFFQVNRFLVDRLVETATEGAAGGSALDLYAGVGLFSLVLASRFERVTAVESGNSAVRDLKANAEQAGVRVETVRTNVEAFLPSVKSTPDFVLADPPRAGLGKAVTAELLRLRPPRVTIVACDPATLARDLGVLTAGGYGIDRLTMVDLFPQTYHLEAVAALALR